jgi:hypothetical protein
MVVLVVEVSHIEAKRIAFHRRELRRRISPLFRDEGAD